MVTRSKIGIFKPIVLQSTTTSSSEPKSVSDALADPNWKDAMAVKFDALQRNHTWSLIPSTPEMNIVDKKWVFRVKSTQMGLCNIT